MLTLIVVVVDNALAVFAQIAATVLGCLLQPLKEGERFLDMPLP